MSILLKLIKALLTPSEIGKFKEEFIKLHIILRVVILVILTILLITSIYFTFAKTSKTSKPGKPETSISISVDQSGTGDVNNISIGK